MTATPPELDLARLVEACEGTTPQADHAPFLTALASHLPQLEFTHVLTRGGWYRPGGVVDSDGQRVSDNLAQWASEESGDDIDLLFTNYGDRDLRATRLDGKTHYFVAATGDAPDEFVQLEVEELVETVIRPLFEADGPPEQLAELLDPAEYTRLEGPEVGAPRYLFRRIAPIAETLRAYAPAGDDRRPIARFMSDWQRSSAGDNGRFCDHWVLALREYRNSDDEPRLQVKPVTTYTGEITAITGAIPRGGELARLIHGFDRQVGYPMAWFFFMLSRREVSHQIAESIHDDLMGAYAYLPARDVKILQQWYDNRYGV